MDKKQTTQIKKLNKLIEKSTNDNFKNISKAINKMNKKSNNNFQWNDDLIKQVIKEKDIQKINELDKNNSSALLYCFENFDDDKKYFNYFKKLLKLGADPNIKVLNRTYLLHLLLEDPNDFFDELIRNSNIDINIKDNDGDVPLSIDDIFINNSVDAFKKLLEKGAIVNNKVLKAILGQDFYTNEIANVGLFNYNHDIDFKNNNYLHQVIGKMMENNAEYFIDIFNFILSHPDTDVNKKNSDGNTAFHLLINEIEFCSEEEKQKIIPFLIDREDVSWEVLDSNKNSLLHHMPSLLDLEVDQQKLEKIIKSSDVNIKNGEGLTPLMCLADCYDSDMKNILYAFIDNENCDLSIENNNGLNVFQLTADVNQKMFNDLVEHLKIKLENNILNEQGMSNDKKLKRKAKL